MLTRDNPTTPNYSEPSGNLSPPQEYPLGLKIDLTTFAECVKKASTAAKHLLEKGEISREEVKESYPVWLTVLGQAIELRILSERVAKTEQENSESTSDDVLESVYVLEFRPKKSLKHQPIAEFSSDPKVYELTQDIEKCFEAVVWFQRHYSLYTYKDANCPNDQLIDKILALVLGYFNEIPLGNKIPLGNESPFSLAKKICLEKELVSQKEEVGNILDTLFGLRDCNRLGQRNRNS